MNKDKYKLGRRAVIWNPTSVENVTLIVKEEHKIEKEVYHWKADPLSLRWVELDLHWVSQNAQRTFGTLNDTRSLTMALGIWVTNCVI